MCTRTQGTRCNSFHAEKVEDTNKIGNAGGKLPFMIRLRDMILA